MPTKGSFTDPALGNARSSLLYLPPSSCLSFTSLSSLPLSTLLHYRLQTLYTQPSVKYPAVVQHSMLIIGNTAQLSALVGLEVRAARMEGFLPSGSEGEGKRTTDQYGRPELTTRCIFRQSKFQ